MYRIFNSQGKLVDTVSWHEVSAVITRMLGTDQYEITMYNHIENMSGDRVEYGGFIEQVRR